MLFGGNITKRTDKMCCLDKPRGTCYTLRFNAMRNIGRATVRI